MTKCFLRKAFPNASRCTPAITSRLRRVLSRFLRVFVLGFSQHGFQKGRGELRFTSVDLAVLAEREEGGVDCHFHDGHEKRRDDEPEHDADTINKKVSVSFIAMYGQTVRGNSPFWHEYGQSQRRRVVIGKYLPEDHHQQGRGYLAVAGGIGVAVQHEEREEPRDRGD